MQSLTEEERRTLNDMARESLMLKILAEVNFDMNVCKLEGWNYRELPERIKSEMDRIITKWEEIENDRRNNDICDS